MNLGWLGIALVALAALAAGGCGDDGGAGGGGTGGSGGAGAGTCSASEACPNGEACIYAQGSCAPEATGSCVAGFTCDGPPTGPVCGCDGEVIEGEMAECTQWANSAPYADPDLCATGTFACGPSMMCTRHVQVCVETIPGVPGGEISYQCVPLSDVQGTCQHGIADCSCMDLSTIGGASCSSDADHQETITIALP
ncbi:MAG: hypothetical protein IT372_35745 [Polyangiaceae bacterium]|nr:hypothetical protein [Polyangiaceae bacterium]